jgi:DNA-binding CsgD family transcriptional regulator
MQRLGPSDYEAVLDFVRQLYAVGQIEEFAATARFGVGRLIPCDILMYKEIQPRRKQAKMIEEPAGALPADRVAAFEHYARQHPLIAQYTRTHDGGARKISDFATLNQFRNLAVYDAFFGKLAINYQMAVGIPAAPELLIGIAANRTRPDFSERDRAVLDLVRPHLLQAYRNVTARASILQRAEAAERALWAASGKRLSSLTGREREVLILVAEGKTNPRIADQLRVSARTVQQHLEHVYGKLDVRSRTSAAIMLHMESDGHTPDGELTSH